MCKNSCEEHLQESEELSTCALLKLLKEKSLVITDLDQSKIETHWVDLKWNWEKLDILITDAFFVGNPPPNKKIYF